MLSIKGASYIRLRRALETCNPSIVTRCGRELPPISLDALAVTLIYLPADPERFERALVRWHARYCLEKRPSADEAQLVRAALRALAGPARRAAAHALAESLDSRRLGDAPRRLEDLPGTE